MTLALTLSSYPDPDPHSHPDPDPSPNRDPTQGGWQYGSHLMEGETPSLLEDAPPLDALPVPPLPLAEPQRDLKRQRAASSPA